MFNGNLSRVSKSSFRQASNCTEAFLKLSNLLILIKQESLYRLKSVLGKSKSAKPLFNGTEVLSSASGKPKLFAEIFSKNYTHILMTQVSLYLFLNMNFHKY